METNIKRIETTLIELSKYNATPQKGCTRFSYSEEDRQAKKYLIGEFKKLGMDITVDAIGNIRARLEGKDCHAPAVMTGSHIDTVLHGGNYDGSVGVVGALETARVIVETKTSVKRPIEIIIFVEEEGSNFGMTTVGSKAMVGNYKLEDLKTLKDSKGISLYDKAKSFGLNPEAIDDSVIKPGEIKAMVELHVEQGNVLETAGVSLGIVKAISGIKAVNVQFKGIPNHAGATPMDLRQDPMVGAAKMILAVEDIVKNNISASTVGTVGRIACSPNVSNIIPEKVTCTIDIRDVDPRGICIAFEKISEEICEIARGTRLEAQIKVVGEVEPIQLSNKVTSVIESIAKDKGVSFLKMNSGAIHDACLLAKITEVGMIFVPSINGRSHVPEEYTALPDIKLGCDLLLNTIVRLANSDCL